MDYCQSARQSLARGETDDAIALLHQAIAEDPRHSDAYALLGEAYVQKGMVNEGIHALSTSISLNPKNVAARVNLAGALRQMGRWYEAALELQDALRVDPHHQRAQELLREVETQLERQRAQMPPEAPVLEIRDDTGVFCPHCGTENDPAANFCRLCGRMMRSNGTRPTVARTPISPPPSLPYAGFWLRAAAYLIDMLVITSIAVLGGILLFPVFEQVTPDADGDAMAGLMGLGIFVLYSIVSIGQWGKTLGMAIARIKVVKEDGSPPGYGAALLRFIVYVVPSCLCGLLTLLNCLSCAWDAHRQTWHDKAANTYVVRG
jgi:uncharacterized RDD family membrane protein YckC